MSTGSTPRSSPRPCSKWITASPGCSPGTASASAEASSAGPRAPRRRGRMLATGSTAASSVLNPSSNSAASSRAKVPGGASRRASQPGRRCGSTSRRSAASRARAAAMRPRPTRAMRRFRSKADSRKSMKASSGSSSARKSGSSACGASPGSKHAHLAPLRGRLPRGFVEIEALRRLRRQLVRLRRAVGEAGAERLRHLRRALRHQVLHLRIEDHRRPGQQFEGGARSEQKAGKACSRPDRRCVSCVLRQHQLGRLEQRHRFHLVGAALRRRIVGAEGGDPSFLVLHADGGPPPGAAAKTSTTAPRTATSPGSSALSSRT